MRAREFISRPAYSYRSDSAVPKFDDNAPMLLMDGECALCTRGARIISKMDHRGEFRICPTNSDLGRAILSHYGLDRADPETWLYLENGLAFGSMEAIIRAGTRLGGLGHLARVLHMVPRSLQDWLYRRIARNRISIFGRADMCAVPDPELRRRLLR
jgi:predicted DCC family thiol-disulfide oxidoreductase YuxK